MVEICLEPILFSRSTATTTSADHMIPTTSADQSAAALAKWFGVEDVDLPTVAPNIGNFAAQNLSFFIQRSFCNLSVCLRANKSPRRYAPRDDSWSAFASG